MEDEHWLKKALKRGIEEMERNDREFNDAGEWFLRLTEEEKNAILSTGTDIQLAYRNRNSRGLLALLD